jgi:omega-hydroxy-beta-dihydromenaquinone-9 sulfotransferase
MTRSLRLSLGAWRRLAKRIDDRSQLQWPTRFAYYLTGIVHSCLFKLQAASHADALRACAPYPPLFLLGFWRSGTTLLHELFCCDPQFGFPTTYACLNPSHFLLTESWARARKGSPTTRPMDQMSYSWASPQEDEFALLELNAPSPYEALLVPSLMRTPGALVDLRQRTPEEQTRWADVFQSFLRLLTVQQGKAMVLKSPSHGFRLPLLLSMFPNARFIVIERNPYEVFASNLKLWRTLLDLYALESPCPEEIEKFVLQAYVIHEQAIAQGKSMASLQQLACVRYEELVAAPMREAERLYQELSLPNFNAARRPMENYARTAAGHARNRFTLSSAQKARIESHWGWLIKEKAYSWPQQYLRVEN